MAMAIAAHHKGELRVESEVLPCFDWKRVFCTYLQSTHPRLSRELLVNSVPSTIWQLMDSFIDSTVHFKKNIRAAASIFKRNQLWVGRFKFADSPRCLALILVQQCQHRHSTK